MNKEERNKSIKKSLNTGASLSNNNILGRLSNKVALTIGTAISASVVSVADAILEKNAREIKIENELENERRITRLLAQGIEDAVERVEGGDIRKYDYVSPDQSSATNLAQNYFWAIGTWPHEPKGIDQV